MGTVDRPLPPRYFWNPNTRRGSSVGSMSALYVAVAEWFVRWNTELATRIRSRVAAGLLTGYSVLSGNLTGYCYQ